MTKFGRGLPQELIFVIFGGREDRGTEPGTCLVPPHVGKETKGDVSVHPVVVLISQQFSLVLVSLVHVRFFVLFPLNFRFL